MTFSLKMQGTSITLSFLCSYSHKISSLLISLFSEFHYTTRVSGSYFPWYCLGPVGRYCSNLSADHRSPVISLSDTGPRSIENSDSLSLPFLGCLREVGKGGESCNYLFSMLVITVYALLTCCQWLPCMLLTSGTCHYSLTMWSMSCHIMPLAINA